MSKEVVVLGAGMVGICTAVHLRKNGYDVTVIDHSTPGAGTSYGNAGVIQREAVEPYAFPRQIQSLIRVGLKRDAAVNYHLSALPSYASPLFKYWKNSEPKSHQAISKDYAALISVALDEHKVLIAEAQAEDLIIKGGMVHAYRTEQALQQGIAHAEHVKQRYGVESEVISPQQFNVLEPNLKANHPIIGAVHWTQPWSVNEPSELVQRYAQLLQDLGGRIIQAEILALQQQPFSWKVCTNTGDFDVAEVVIALGPWSSKFISALGYENPILIKRGYHQHFTDGAIIHRPIFDAERGYVLAPMKRGTRLTTGAEFAHFSAPATPVQLEKTQQAAYDWLDLGQALDEPAWLGGRPCSVDMKPYIGAAPRHKGLWFNFGHGHQGFTLGPASGRLLAEIMIDQVRLLPDEKIFSPQRMMV
ncbi:FAD-dependent oxidoreductase [Acinetobacter sp.]|uniref:NAD(P)/FAD-dependent oxidoreductase n=1 Tax=Acinetobacter sp. TaxID=472 RepID=UPI0031E47DC9